MGTLLLALVCIALVSHKANSETTVSILGFNIGTNRVVGRNWDIQEKVITGPNGFSWEQSPESPTPPSLPFPLNDIVWCPGCLLTKVYGRPTWWYTQPPSGVRQSQPSLKSRVESQSNVPDMFKTATPDSFTKPTQQPQSLFAGLQQTFMMPSAIKTPTPFFLQENPYLRYYGTPVYQKTPSLNPFTMPLPLPEEVSQQSSIGTSQSLPNKRLKVHVVQRPSNAPYHLNRHTKGNKALSRTSTQGLNSLDQKIELGILDLIKALTNVNLPHKTDPTPLDFQNSMREPTPLDIQNSMREPTPLDFQNSMREPTPLDFQNSMREPTPLDFQNSMREPTPLDFQNSMREPTPLDFQNSMREPTPLDFQNSMREIELTHKIAMKKVVDKQTAPKSTVKGKITPGNTVEGVIAPEHTLEGQSTPKSTLEDQIAPKNTLEGKNTPGNTVEGLIAPEHTLEGQSTPKSTALDQIAPKNTVEGQSVPESKVEPQIAPENAVEPQIAQENAVQEQVVDKNLEKPAEYNHHDNESGIKEKDEGSTKDKQTTPEHNTQEPDQAKDKTQEDNGIKTDIVDEAKNTPEDKVADNAKVNEAEDNKPTENDKKPEDQGRHGIERPDKPFKVNKATMRKVKDERLNLNIKGDKISLLVHEKAVIRSKTFMNAGNKPVREVYKNNVLIERTGEKIKKRKLQAITTCDGRKGKYEDDIDFTNKFHRVYDEDMSLLSEVTPDSVHLKTVDQTTGDLYEETYTLGLEGKLILQKVNGGVVCQTH